MAPPNENAPPADNTAVTARSTGVQLDGAQRVAVRPYVDCVRRDLPFHAFVGAYALLTFDIAEVFHVPAKFAPFSYLGLVSALPRVLLLLVACAGLCSLGSRQPLRSFRAALAACLGPHTIAGLLLFGSLSIFLGVFTSLKTMLPDIVPYYADPLLARADGWLHGADPWRYTAAVLPSQFTPMLERVYFGLWAVLLSGCLLAVLLVPRLRPRRTQYVWTFLWIYPVLGNLFAGAMMSGGPVYYERLTGGHRFDGLMQLLAQHSIGRDWVVALWNGYVSGTVGVGSGISAFPSMHLANATMYVLLAGCAHRRLLWIAVPFGAIMMFGSVRLGWHYAIDGYFAIAATVLIWNIVGWRVRRNARGAG